MSPSSSFHPVSVHFVVNFVLLVLSKFCEAGRPVNNSISAVFVFGDSTVDSGNNNYIKTITKSNFPPYGEDFPDHIPTGRFTNGRLVTDILASYLGIKDYIPAYLDPTLTVDDLKTGVCFASAGTGFDPLTSQIDGVISIQKQLKYFEEYKSRMEAYIGKERTVNLISRAVFLVSAGTNDFIVNYYGPLTPMRRRTYNISTYQNFILQRGNHLIQGLLGMGARKIAFVGLPPIGCLPAVITLNSDNALTHRGCIQHLSSVAQDYNLLLQTKLKSINTRATRIIYVDIYKPVDDMIKNPTKFGFDKVNEGCCGSGIIETSIFCNPYSFVCSDVSKYVFWDAVHPTSVAFYNIFQAVRPIVDLFIKDY